MTPRLQHRRALLLIVPSAIVFVIGFVVPLAYMVRYSLLHYSPSSVAEPPVTLSNYLSFFKDDYTRGILIRTLRVAFFTTLAALVLGYPLAYYLTRARGAVKRVVIVIVLSPMLISSAVLAFAWLELLAPSTGLVAQATSKLPLIGSDSSTSLLYTERGLVLALTYETLVFMVITLHASLETIDRIHLRAAAVLGARPSSAFVRVTLPLSLPGIFSGCVLVFSIAASSLLIPLVVGAGRVPMLATYAYSQNTTTLNWPAGATAGLVLLVVTLVLLFGFTLVVSRMRRGTRRPAAVPQSAQPAPEEVAV
ncbi:MAG TPA: ABC transporter permease [Solirubrobacter sp.]|nr:ABC transporter permease [Solirubrobacter sp.]